MADANVKTDGDSKETITIRVKDQTGEETLFKVRRGVESTLLSHHEALADTLLRSCLSR
jgi:hypothetical protein